MTPCTSRVVDRFEEFLRPFGRTFSAKALPLLLGAARAARAAGYPSLAATSPDSGVLTSWWRRSSRHWEPRARRERFAALRHYFRWLYEQGVVEAYALRGIRGSELAGTGWVSLRLARPLQRAIDAHVTSLGWHSEDHRRRIQRVLVDFERFWNVRGGPLTRRTVVAWLRHGWNRRPQRDQSEDLGSLRRFLEAQPALWHGGRHGSSPADFSILAVVRALREGRRIPRLGPLEARTALTPHWRRFVLLKRRMGRRYDSEEYLYRRLDRFLLARGFERLEDLTPARLEDFVSAAGITRSRSFHLMQQRFRVLFRHLVARGILESDPTARLRGRGAASAPPYVFTHREIAALLQAARELPRQEERGWPVYTMFHLLYACGLRVGELRRLQLQDVDLANRCLRIHQTKFYKDRLVPFNDRVAENLKGYLDWRLRRYPPRSPQEPLFVSLQQGAFCSPWLCVIFGRLRRAAGIRPAIPGQRATIHSLRRTFAVHRLMRWYREGEDVNAKLPLLATYMGHKGWERTTVYLTMTPALMKTAARRFVPRFQETLGEAP